MRDMHVDACMRHLYSRSLSCLQLDDLTVTVDSQRGRIGQLEKKQKKFDSVTIVLSYTVIYI